MKRAFLVILGTLTGIVSLLKLDPAFDRQDASDAILQESPPAVPEQTSPSAVATTDVPSPTATPSQPAANTPQQAAQSGGTYTGSVSWTEWGPVQVRITVENGRITKSEAIQTPNNERKTIQINELAIPWLNEQAIALQSANLDGVSGATYTSRSYEVSLASAMAKAGL